MFGAGSGHWHWGRLAIYSDAPIVGPVVAALTHRFSRWAWHYAALGLGIGMDQLTKYLCLALLPAYTPIHLMPGLALQLVYNRGAAYGFFAGQTPWLVGIASLFSLYFMATFHVDRWQSPSPLGSRLLIIGALGNLLDRMIHGFVIDFISIGRFPVFNIADICITVGIGLLIYRSLRQA